jgi:hypothetical protein
VLVAVDRVDWRLRQPPEDPQPTVEQRQHIAFDAGRTKT